MADENTFQERLARIQTTKGADAPDRPSRPPRPAPKGAGLGAIPPKIFLYAVVLGIAGAGMMAIKQNPISPLAAVEKANPEGSRMHSCMNDPKLRAKLKAQGHRNVDYAAMLMCG